MQREPIFENQLGFTLVEMMISATLLSVAILGASYALISEKKASQGLSLQTEAQQIIHQIVSRIESEPNLFPYLLASSGTNTVTYVGCFASTGESVPNMATGKVGFYGADLGVVPPLNTAGAGSTAFENPAPGSAVGIAAPLICPQNTGTGTGTAAGYLPAAIEIHVSRILATGGASNGQMRIHAMILNNGSAGTTNNTTSLNNRQYQAAVTHFDFSVDIAMVASASGSAPNFNQTPFSF